MKEYVDEKFWRMLSGFVTLLALSIIILIAIKVYTDEQVKVSLPSTANVSGQ